YTRHFRSEGTKLVDHRIDGVLELQNFALDVDGDLLGQVSVGYSGGHLGDITYLSCEITCHGVDRVGQVFPGAGNAADFSLTAEFAFRAHFASYTRHFGSECGKLVHHCIDGVFELENLAPDVDSDLLGKI